ncbi:MAG: flagellar hook-length control protein FliK [Xanthobacteraceae bacterium]|nr:flagellar hook-length control protein FliK [Xanthobacteraceae bacterium]
MTKLNGTSGQLFAGIAESINTRGAARSAKHPTGPAHEDSSFKDLLHTVSSLAKVALNDRKSEASTKTGNLRTRLAQPAEPDESKAETVSEHAETVDQRDSPRISGPLDHRAKADTQNQPTLPAIVGQELAALPVVKPQAQTPGSSRTAGPARSEQPSGARGPSVGSAAPAIKTNAAESETRPPVGARPAAAPPPQGEAAPQVSAAPSKNMPASGGFEAVAANIEHAVRASGRETLQEMTKVTVVQQQTHLPPVAQFTPTQQVASAVVAELESSAASTSASAPAPDLAGAQSNGADQPLKILTISLEPAQLGNVTVRLRLVGAAISVHLAADRRDTSQMLNQQRDAIQELMQSAGYVADVAPVQHGSLDGFQAGSGQPQSSLPGQQQQWSQPQGTFDGSSTSSGQPDGGAKQARQERRPNQETRHDPDVAPLDRRGPVYL